LVTAAGSGGSRAPGAAEILVIQLGRLGDLVQTLPLIRRLRQEHPSGCITLVCLANVKDILVGSGGWDRLVPVRLEDTDALAGPEGRESFPAHPPFNAFPELAGRYDLVVNLTSDRGSAALCECIAGERKLGRIQAPEGEIRLLGPWSKYLFAMVNRRRGNLFNLVDLHMGMAGLDPKPQPPCLRIGSDRLTEARRQLMDSGWKGGRPLVAVQTGASDLHRAWEIERFGALGALLADDGAEILLVGDGGETGRAARFREAAGRPVIDLVGRTDLVRLPAVLACADLLVSNDTGTIHVAAAVGTPTLGLFFATAYYSETAPYGEGHAVLQVETPCSPCSASTRCAVQKCRDHLAVRDVHAAVRWLLRPGSEPPRLPETLALYRSRFLENGTLVYAPPMGPPVDGKGEASFLRAPSEAWLEGLLGRLVWEGALGIPRDPALEAAWKDAGREQDRRTRRDALSAMLDALSTPVRRGREIAGRIHGLFLTSDPAPPDLLRPLHAQLSRNGEALFAACESGGLFGAYVRMEMMDMEYLAYPGLAAEMERKYRSLEAWMDRTRASLDDL
jgi:ADP-heptose:LPS heptosyltransferase